MASVTGVSPTGVFEQPDFERQSVIAYDPRPARSQSTNVHIAADRNLGSWARVERYNNFGGLRTGLHGDGDLKWLSTLKLRCLKVWIAVGDPQRYHDYLRSAESVSEEVMINVGTGQTARDPAQSLDAFTRELYEFLLAIKRNHPKVVWVECLNEYRPRSGDWRDPNRFDEYFAFFESFRVAVDRVNRELSPERPLLLGGPVTTQFSEVWFHELLDRLDQKSLSIDFLSYHQYLFHRMRGRPARIRPERAVLSGMLERRGINPRSMPMFVTEIGVFPGGPYQNTGEFDADLVTQAAGILSSNYWYIEQADGDARRGSPLPFQWVTRHGQHAWKNQLVADRDGVPTPQGHALRLLSLLHRDRLAAASDAIDADGVGVYVLATGGPAAVSALLWNYQWIDGRTTHEVTVRLTGVEAGDWKLRQYAIDDAHSNHRKGYASSGPELVQQTSVSIEPDTSAIRLSLPINGIALIQLSR
ncbi:MAG TPA: hypothetical protein PKB10_09765 [Tepidisphaeraceae bacterium]|nr:hypothetical protein [Tepidisphaeraceae bacterium]